MEVQEHVNSIANNLTSGNYDFDAEHSDHDEPCAADYLTDVLDIEYIVSGDRTYLGARILVAFGGPNIWINTRTGTVDGYWWCDEGHATFNDTLELDEYLEELWNCTA